VTVVQIVALIAFIAGGLTPFAPGIDTRVAFVLLAVAGALLCLDVGGVID
jgi:hypothetical protein